MGLVTKSLAVILTAAFVLFCAYVLYIDIMAIKVEGDKNKQALLGMNIGIISLTTLASATTLIKSIF